MAITETTRTKGSRSEGKGYVAEITGLSGRYGFEREFLRAVEYSGDEATFALEPGKVYEVKDLDRVKLSGKHLILATETDYEHLESAEVAARFQAKRPGRDNPAPPKPERRPA